jgi:hypothetical protein
MITYFRGFFKSQNAGKCGGSVCNSLAYIQYIAMCVNPDPGGVGRKMPT